MDKKYYHLTTDENAKRILKEGLLPIHGERKDMIHDEREGVFLCCKEDIPYWKIILNLPAILEISNVKIDDENMYNYIDYKEYVYTNKIESKDIKRVNMKVETTEAMKTLSHRYIMSLSLFTVHCARYVLFFSLPRQ